MAPSVSSQSFLLLIYSSCLFGPCRFKLRNEYTGHFLFRLAQIFVNEARAGRPTGRVRVSDPSTHQKLALPLGGDSRSRHSIFGPETH
jgi:hypothetical protein